MIQDHPCFHCTLPDCDDRNPRCQIRRAYNHGEKARLDHQPMPDHLRENYKIACREFYGHLKMGERDRRRAGREQAVHP